MYSIQEYPPLEMTDETLRDRKRPESTSTTNKVILVIEDEADLADLVRFNLGREGYTCRVAGTGVTALSEIQRRRPDLIILDRMLPSISGDDVTARLQRDPRTASIPIIMLTAKAEEADELVGFAMGAADYITKPFSMKRLIARVGAVLRRLETTEQTPEILSFGPFAIDLSRHELTIHGTPVSLTATEFRLLRTLMAADGRVYSRAQLIDTVLGMDAVVTDRTIDVHVTALRRKLGSVGADPSASAWIQTIRGVGYTFRPPSACPV